jgi:hypothetical protein
MNTQSPKQSASLPRMNSSFVKHLIHPQRVSARGISQHCQPHSARTKVHVNCNLLTSILWCRSTFSLRRKLTRDVWPCWVAICRTLTLSCKRQMERARRDPVTIQCAIWCLSFDNQLIQRNSVTL